MSQEENKTIVRRFFEEAWNQRTGMSSMRSSLRP
jgi:hypothetical protein